MTSSSRLSKSSTACSGMLVRLLPERSTTCTLVRPLNAPSSTSVIWLWVRFNVVNSRRVWKVSSGTSARELLLISRVISDGRYRKLSASTCSISLFCKYRCSMLLWSRNVSAGTSCSWLFWRFSCSRLVGPYMVSRLTWLRLLCPMSRYSKSVLFANVKPSISDSLFPVKFSARSAANTLKDSGVIRLMRLKLRSRSVRPVILPHAWWGTSSNWFEPKDSVRRAGNDGRESEETSDKTFPDRSSLTKYSTVSNAFDSIRWMEFCFRDNFDSIGLLLKVPLEMRVNRLPSKSSVLRLEILLKKRSGISCMLFWENLSFAKFGTLSRRSDGSTSIWLLETSSVTRLPVLWKDVAGNERMRFWDRSRKASLFWRCSVPESTLLSWLELRSNVSRLTILLNSELGIEDNRFFCSLNSHTILKVENVSRFKDDKLLLLKCSVRSFALFRNMLDGISVIALFCK